MPSNTLTYRLLSTTLDRELERHFYILSNTLTYRLQSTTLDMRVGETFLLTKQYTGSQAMVYYVRHES